MMPKLYTYGLYHGRESFCTGGSVVATSLQKAMQKIEYRVVVKLGIDIDEHQVAVTELPPRWMRRKPVGPLYVIKENSVWSWQITKEMR